MRALLQWLGLSLCMLISPGIAYAQAAPVLLGRITGAVRDSASGAPILRGLVCGALVGKSPMESQARCSATDEGGRYRLDSMSAGTFTFRVNCTGDSPLTGRELARRIIQVAPGTTTEWNIDASEIGCDQRPMEQIHGRIDGLYYNPDFEGSWFFADGQTHAHATLNVINSALWPDAFLSLPRASVYGLGCVRVTLAGTLRGPLSGSRGEDNYGLAVDTIVAARPVAEEECFKVVERFLPAIRSNTKQYRRGGG